MGNERGDRYNAGGERHFIHIEDRSRFKRAVDPVPTKAEPTPSSYSPFQPLDVYSTAPKKSQVSPVETRFEPFTPQLTPQPTTERLPIGSFVVNRAIESQLFVAPVEPKQEKLRALWRGSLRVLSKKPKLRNTLKTQNLLVGMAVFVFALGVFVSIQTLMTNHSAKSQVAALSKKVETQGGNSNASGDVPSETKPKGGAAYSVAPNLPKYIKIPKLGVDARVASLGLKSDNELKAPSNIYDTGWYSASAKPGDAASLGAMLIDGHVHGPTLPGVFVSIKKLVAGDTIQIVRGDNQVFNYKVVRVQNYDASTLDMGMMLSSVQPGEPGLNLITCGGPYDSQSGEYTQRTAVFAVQM